MVNEVGSTYQGNGKITVRRSDIAIAFNTRLVGDNICRLLRINMIKMFDKSVITKIRGIIYLERT